MTEQVDTALEKMDALSSAVRSQGAMPVFAFSVLPAMAVLHWVRGIYLSLFLSALLGALIGIAGYVVAFFMAYPVGATQAVVGGLVAIVAMVGGRHRGLARPS